MAKRKKGHQPLLDSHPDRWWLPDVPGHQQKITNNAIKETLVAQVKRLREELGISKPEAPEGFNPSGENKG